MASGAGEDGKAPPSKAVRKGRGRTITIIALVVAAIVILAIVGLSVFPHETFDFTYFEGTSITTTHLPSGNETSWQRWQFSPNIDYDVGRPMEFWVSNFNPGPGTVILSGVASNTTGFTFVSSDPALPNVAINTTDQQQGTKVNLKFETPSTKYSGPFRFILYFDCYPGTGEKNVLTTVTETQVVTVHSSGGTEVQTYHIGHPEFAGEYDVGESFQLEEPYRYTGPGRSDLTAIASDMPGFVLISCYPALPLTLPNATQPYIWVSMSFQAPLERYTGPFNYTTYFDCHVDWVEPSYHHLTSVLEVQYVTSYFGPLNSTARFLVWHNDTTGLYSRSLPITITEPYWNVGSGSMSITGISANTTGFSFIGAVPSLPVAVPNSPDQTSGNVT
ncbi:MAG: hypothetical protein MUE65_05765, partial [Methanomassiliicoccales archaeon]|nr:hypothetical protein [Methanomassiliicoccales archaeon]